MKTVCIIQARLGSTRLPGKVLRPILGRPMISYMIERVREVKKIDQILIATTNRESDTPIAEFCQREEVAVFRGSEQDVLDRYYEAAKKVCADVIVRLTADCPLIDPSVVEQVLEVFLKGHPKIDFVSNVNPARFPDGMDTEVFSFNALEREWKEAKSPLEREHVTPYFSEVPGRFQTRNVEAGEDFSRYRLTVDYEEDFEVVKAVLQNLYPPRRIFGYREMINFLERHPDVKEKNQKYNRNPWYESYRASAKASQR